MFSSEFVGSDFAPTQNPEQSLARYKSAPGSFLAALLDSDNNNNTSADNNSSSGDESAEAFFITTGGGPTSHRIKKEGSPPAGGLESAVSGGGGFIVGSYSVGMDTRVHSNGGSTSPAFLNGFGVMGEMGNYNTHNMSFSSAPPSTTRFRPSDNVREFETVYPRSSWNESSFSDGGVKRNRDGEMRMFSEFRGWGNNQNNNGESRKGSSGLVHHLSLPKTSTEMAEDVEKFLQFQTETVPCQVRAKRGCATHPRSIAERVRRTRISEKMKKLQDLFPNMDKQTSTADMLDLAVEYIKDLQKQVETLADMKTRCVCSGKTQQHGSVI